MYSIGTVTITPASAGLVFVPESLTVSKETKGILIKAKPLESEPAIIPIKVGAGRHYTLALKNDGAAWVWGRNVEGQLGDGTRTNRVAPIQISDLNDVFAIAGGGYHTIALKNDGTVWAWGNNYYGQLGDGTIIDHYAPVQVAEF
jgi:hypothetical protein